MIEHDTEASGGVSFIEESFDLYKNTDILELAILKD